MKTGTVLLVLAVAIAGWLINLQQSEYYGWTGEPGDYSAEAYEKDGGVYVWTVDIAEAADALEALTVKTINGRVTVNAEPDAETVEGTARIEIRSSFLGSESKVMEFKTRVGVATERENGHLTLRADQPRRTPWGIGGVTVHFDLTVPGSPGLTAESVNGKVSVDGAEASVRAKTVNGEVRIAGCHGPVNAGTVNGAVNIAGLSGPLKAETVNGSISVEFAAPPQPGNECAASAVNGSIHLALPESAAFHAIAGTVNGSIKMDNWPFEGERKKKSVNGAVNGGGPAVRANTVNGSITYQMKPIRSES